jgi:hypothetical protein
MDVEQDNVPPLHKKRKLSALSVRQRPFGMNAMVTIRSRRRYALALRCAALASQPFLGQFEVLIYTVVAWGFYYLYVKEVEFVAYRIPPTIRTNPRINDFSPDNFRVLFRFEKHHALPLMLALGLHPGTSIHVQHGQSPQDTSCWDMEEAFLLLLARFTITNRLTDLETVHGRDYSSLSRCFNSMVDLVFANNYRLVWDNMDFFVPFSGWDYATIKQTNGTTNFCNITQVDSDYMQDS